MSATSPAQPSNRCKVLLVDDDEAVATIMRLRLGKYFDLVSTTDPFQAVALARAEQPDVVLCDINMPGMNGDEVVFALSEDPRTAHIPVIYLTSLLTPRQTTELGEMFGGHVGISKSATTAELLAVIESALPG